MQKMDDWSAREIAARVARHELSAEAVARAFVERVEALEPGMTTLELNPIRMRRATIYWRGPSTCG